MMTMKQTTPTTKAEVVDMKKLTIVEMLKDAGYAESQNPEMYSGCEHVILSKTYEDEVEVCWYGKQKS